MIARRRGRDQNLKLPQQDFSHQYMDRRWYYLFVVILLAGIPFHQPLLVVVGLLGLLVVGTTDMWAHYCMHDLRYQRELSEQRALYGEQITLSLTIENAKLLPLPWLEIEDTVPRALTFTGRQLRISVSSNNLLLETLFSPRWYERVTRRYTVQCSTRGVHTFGPTVLRSGDVFGFLNREISLPNRQYLLVYPLVVPITRFGLPARHPFGDHRAPRRLLEDPSRVIGVRDYMYGDELRRVHWKATARTMQLQSKVYDATTTYTMVLFLNVVTQLDVYYGIHPELQELAICAAASVGDWALNQGYAVGLYANTIMYMPEEAGLNGDAQGAIKRAPTTGTQDEPKSHEGVINHAPTLDAVLSEQVKRRRIHLPPSTSEEQRKRLMEVLARIQSYFGNSIEDVIQTERTRLPAGATVVVITSTLSDQLLDTLTRVKQSGHAVAILFVGDSPLPAHVSGLALYRLGGEETWRELEASYSNATEDEAETLRGSSPSFLL